MDTNDAMALLEQSLGDLFGLLTEDQLLMAINAAKMELGWAFPVSDNTQKFWFGRRSERHSLRVLQLSAAKQFKYKQINVNQKFDHYTDLIKSYDEEFNAAQEQNPALFAGTDAYKMFGTYVHAGFAYDDAGKDITYEEIMQVQMSGV